MTRTCAPRAAATAIVALAAGLLAPALLADENAPASPAPPAPPAEERVVELERRLAALEEEQAALEEEPEEQAAPAEQVPLAAQTPAQRAKARRSAGRGLFVREGTGLRRETAALTLAQVRADGRRVGGSLIEIAFGRRGSLALAVLALAAGAALVFAAHRARRRLDGRLAVFGAAKDAASLATTPEPAPASEPAPAQESASAPGSVPASAAAAPAADARAAAAPAAAAPAEGPPAATPAPEPAPEPRPVPEEPIGTKLRYLGLRIARATVRRAAILAAGAAVAAAAGAGVEGTLTVALLLAIPFADELLRSLLRGLFDREARLRIIGVDDEVAARFYSHLRVATLLASTFLPLILVLHLNGYPAATVNVLWLAYYVASLAVLVLLFGRRALFLSLFREPRSTAGQAIRRVLRILHPFLAAYVAGILVIRLAGYRALSEYLAVRTVLTAALAIAVAVAWKYARERMGRWLRREVAAVHEEVDVPDEVRRESASRHGVATSVLLGVKYALVIGTAFAALVIWLPDPSDVAGSLKVPLVAEVTAAHVFAAALIFLCTLLGGRVLRLYMVRRWLPRTQLDRGTQVALGNLAFFALVGLGGYLGIRALQVELGALNWLFGALGIGIGFGLQNIVSNLVSGVILLIEKPIKTDDWIDIGDLHGRVDEIGVRSTVVVDGRNVATIVPNSDLVTERVINWNYGDTKTRIAVPVGVACGTEAETVRKVLVELGGQHARVRKRPAPEVFLIRFGESSTDFELRVWVDDPGIIPRVQSDLNYAIDAAFRRAGIEMPYPQRDIHIREPVPVIIHRPDHPPRPKGPGPEDRRRPPRERDGGPVEGRDRA